MCVERLEDISYLPDNIALSIDHPTVPITKASKSTNARSISFTHNYLV